eukprot:UN16329
MMSANNIKSPSLSSNSSSTSTTGINTEKKQSNLQLSTEESCI